MGINVLFTISCMFLVPGSIIYINISQNYCLVPSTTLLVKVFPGFHLYTWNHVSISDNNYCSVLNHLDTRNPSIQDINANASAFHMRLPPLPSPSPFMQLCSQSLYLVACCHMFPLSMGTAPTLSTSRRSSIWQSSCYHTCTPSMGSMQQQRITLPNLKLVPRWLIISSIFLFPFVRLGIDESMHMHADAHTCLLFHLPCTMTATILSFLVVYSIISHPVHCYLWDTTEF